VINKGEIRIRYKELESCIKELNALEEVLGEGSAFCSDGTSKYISYGNGGMFDAVNNAAQELYQVENYLRIVVTRTKQVMINAGCSFAESEENIIAMLQQKLQREITREEIHDKKTAL
jgi:hypothetical protein